MAKNSLFAILLHSPWWISVAIAGGIGVVARVMLPEANVVYGAFVATPLLVIAGICRDSQDRGCGLRIECSGAIPTAGKSPADASSQRSST
jgi:restriction system protein